MRDSDTQGCSSSKPRNSQGICNRTSTTMGTRHCRLFSASVQTSATSFRAQAAYGRYGGDRKAAVNREGIRIIYYWLATEDHVYLLTLYRKGVKDDLTRDELAAWRRVVEDIEND